MSRIGRGPGALRRWGAAGALAAAFAAAPSVAGRLPVATPDVGPAVLLQRIVASERVPYVGYAESASAVGLPDVPEIGRLVNLLGETSRLRAWYAAPDQWRVDALNRAGEHGTYGTGDGTWLWDSGERRATRITGTPKVRLPRAADMLPPELGRRMARLVTDGDRVTRTRGRRIAGVHAAGLRIHPDPAGTTVRRVDVWADPRTGLPVRVEITPKGRDRPLVTTTFLDLERRSPNDDDVRFVPPADVTVGHTTAGDLAARLDEELYVPLPDSLAGLRKRATVANAAATYGTGFGIVAVVALPDHLAYRVLRALGPPFAAEVEGPYGTATVVTTPLLNGLIVLDPRRGIGYAVSGTVPVAALLDVASGLVRG